MNAKSEVIILTLARHREGIWVKNLQEELQHLDLIVNIVTLESILAGLDVDISSVCVLVNRVSDAAEPHLVKACCGFLSCCEVPVWNGLHAYALCTNKYCQHKLLERAKLHTPRTTRFFKDSYNDFEYLSAPDQIDLSFPILLKPNSGGFGAGIIQLNNKEELHKALTEVNLSDSIALLQQFIHVENIYRVWWLKQRVQCGVIRHLTNPQQFTDGCTAGSQTCSISHRPPKLRAYRVPDDVRDEIETKLLPLLPTGHCGSVEFLIDKHGKRLYFDVNLLSTLPIVDTIECYNEVWGNDYNPWKELAESIAQFGSISSAPR